MHFAFSIRVLQVLPRQILLHIRAMRAQRVPVKMMITNSAKRVLVD